MVVAIVLAAPANDAKEMEKFCQQQYEIAHAYTERLKATKRLCNSWACHQAVDCLIGDATEYEAFWWAMWWVNWHPKDSSTWTGDRKGWHRKAADILGEWAANNPRLVPPIPLSQIGR